MAGFHSLRLLIAIISFRHISIMMLIAIIDIFIFISLADSFHYCFHFAIDFRHISFSDSFHIFDDYAIIDYFDAFRCHPY
jgi:hypothetical protein